jgi:uncharacterized membrane protein YccC
MDIRKSKRKKAMQNIFSRIPPFWKSINFRSPKTINSFRTALACLIGYLFVIFSHLPQSQWIVITIIVVMSAQISIGSLFIKAKMRFWGTVWGALVSVIIILVCGNNPVLIGIAFFLTILCFTYLAGNPGDIGLVGTLGSVTVAIILLAETTNLTIAAKRFIVILIGILLATLISYFVFPIRSHSIFLSNLYNTLSYFQKYFENIFKGSDKDIETFLDLDENITKIFIQQRRLIHETGLELGKTRTDQMAFQQVIQAERRIYRAMNLIYYSLNDTETGSELIKSLQQIENFKQEISKFLLRLAETIKFKNNDKLDFSIDETITSMENDFKNILYKSEYPSIFDVTTFLFAAKFLEKELKSLEEAISKIRYLKYQDRVG